MASVDYAIQARVRQLLARHWVRAEGLVVGTTEGVVVLKGPLAVEPGGGTRLDDPLQRARFLQRLRTEVAAIPGVREVVLEMGSDLGTED